MVVSYGLKHVKHNRGSEGVAKDLAPHLSRYHINGIIEACPHPTHRPIYAPMIEVYKIAFP